MFGRSLSGRPLSGRSLAARPLAYGDPTPNAGGGANAAAYAPYTAPAGYRWDFVYDTDNSRVSDRDGSPVVDLVRIS